LATPESRARQRLGYLLGKIASGEPAPASGSAAATVVAAERWKQLLAEYPDPGIDPAVDEQLKEFIARRKGELGDSP